MDKLPNVSQVIGNNLHTFQTMLQTQSFYSARMSFFSHLVIGRKLEVSQYHDFKRFHDNKVNNEQAK